jgi:hypothetical protein
VSVILNLMWSLKTYSKKNLRFSSKSINQISGKYS